MSYAFQFPTGFSLIPGVFFMLGCMGYLSIPYRILTRDYNSNSTGLKGILSIPYRILTLIMVLGLTYSLSPFNSLPDSHENVTWIGIICNCAFNSLPDSHLDHQGLSLLPLIPLSIPYRILTREMKETVEEIGKILSIPYRILTREREEEYERIEDFQFPTGFSRRYLRRCMRWQHPFNSLPDSHYITACTTLRYLLTFNSLPDSHRS